MSPPTAPLLLPPTVLVTGAAKRLGREIALLLAAQGWRVAVHYRDSLEEARLTAAECARHTPGAQAFRANLGNETAVRNLLPTVLQAFGRLDALVNCASTFEHDSARSFGFAALEKHMRSNVGAAILLSQALHDHVAQRRAQDPQASGVVVNLLDPKLWNQDPDCLSYTLSKAALEAATTMLAMGLSPLLRVAAVAPGPTSTRQPGTPAHSEALHQHSPLGPASTPHEVAAAVRLVLENRSITATTLLVDGGQHLMRLERNISLM